MSSALEDLYQEVILDHHRSPRGFGALEDPTGSAEGFNPLCGDRVRVTVRVRDDRVDDVRFEGVGCAISRASASLMTGAVKGLATTEVLSLGARFRDLVTGKAESATGLGKLAALAGVRNYPLRVKCATLAWHTLEAALEGRGGTVSTEDGG